MTKAIEQLDAKEALELLQRCDQYAAPCVFQLLQPAVQAELRRAVHAARGASGR